MVKKGFICTTSDFEQIFRDNPELHGREEIELSEGVYTMLAPSWDPKKYLVTRRSLFWDYLQSEGRREILMLERADYERKTA